MGNIMGIQRPDLITLQGHQRHGVTIIAYEFHLKRNSIAVDKHGGPHVPAHQSMLCEITGQRHDIQFTDWFHDFESG